MEGMPSERSIARWTAYQALRTYDKPPRFSFVRKRDRTYSLMGLAMDQSMAPKNDYDKPVADIYREVCSLSPLERGRIGGPRDDSPCKN